VGLHGVGSPVSETLYTRFLDGKFRADSGGARMFLRFHLNRMETGSALVTAEIGRLSGCGDTCLGLRPLFEKPVSIFEFEKNVTEFRRIQHEHVQHMIELIRIHMTKPKHDETKLQLRR
jgi:hypothetical protein